MTNSVAIRPIPAFNDNYIWCLNAGTQAAVVDPGDAAPVLAFLEQQNLTLSAILVTHHHFDHVDGIAALLARWPQATVYGPDNGVESIEHRLSDGDQISVFDLTFSVLAVPGHTLDHIAYFCEPEVGEPILFCGDTLFAGGCGRIFEGTPPQMKASLEKLARLPASTAVYCAHEYTLANLNFALAAEPGNTALQARFEKDSQSREQGIPTVPSKIDVELATNPFLRSHSPELQQRVIEHGKLDKPTETEIFTALRQWKNEF
ncbi:hydroxyacylglutathione hydrolase [Spongiibacter sp. KMU-158]|uniref:Hydroxyacylglutathione hydrolase n=1 Tax=Spongiibacter pelagi TaxID=2760804 RepID=A0A927GXD6_9GAMM|nr:hydroxyacylglutathione hydrolase [Spongiibacter pelagi]MBD2859892.1 hydroxyacylglutathione hydrolase [Spongiibacter pelagi]